MSSFESKEVVPGSAEDKSLRALRRLHASRGLSQPLADEPTPKLMAPESQSPRPPTKPTDAEGTEPKRERRSKRSEKARHRDKEPMASHADAGPEVPRRTRKTKKTAEKPEGELTASVDVAASQSLEQRTGALLPALPSLSGFALLDRDSDRPCDRAPRSGASSRPHPHLEDEYHPLPIAPEERSGDKETSGRAMPREAAASMATGDSFDESLSGIFETGREWLPLPQVSPAAPPVSPVMASSSDATPLALPVVVVFGRPANLPVLKMPVARRASSPQATTTAGAEGFADLIPRSDEYQSPMVPRAPEFPQIWGAGSTDLAAKSERSFLHSPRAVGVSAFLSPLKKLKEAVVVARLERAVQGQAPRSAFVRTALAPIAASPRSAVLVQPVEATAPPPTPRSGSAADLTAGTRATSPASPHRMSASGDLIQEGVSSVTGRSVIAALREAAVSPPPPHSEASPRVRRLASMLEKASTSEQAGAGLLNG